MGLHVFNFTGHCQATLQKSWINVPSHPCGTRAPLPSPIPRLTSPCFPPPCQQPDGGRGCFHIAILWLFVGAAETQQREGRKPEQREDIQSWRVCLVLKGISGDLPARKHNEHELWIWEDPGPHVDSKIISRHWTSLDHQRRTTTFVL